MIKINTFTYDLRGDNLLLEYIDYRDASIDSYVNSQPRFPTTDLLYKAGSSAVLKQQKEGQDFYNIIVVSQLTDRLNHE